MTAEGGVCYSVVGVAHRLPVRRPITAKQGAALRGYVPLVARGKSRTRKGGLTTDCRLIVAVGSDSSNEDCRARETGSPPQGHGAWRRWSSAAGRSRARAEPVLSSSGQPGGRAGQGDVGVLHGRHARSAIRAYVLREAIAWGATDGVLVSDPAFAGSETLATARALTGVGEGGPVRARPRRSQPGRCRHRAGRSGSGRASRPAIRVRYEAGGAVRRRGQGPLRVRRRPQRATCANADRAFDVETLDRASEGRPGRQGGGPWGQDGNGTYVGEVRVLELDCARRLLHGSDPADLDQAVRLIVERSALARADELHRPTVPSTAMACERTGHRCRGRSTAAIGRWRRRPGRPQRRRGRGRYCGRGDGLGPSGAPVGDPVAEHHVGPRGREAVLPPRSAPGSPMTRLAWRSAVWSARTTRNCWRGSPHSEGGWSLQSCGARRRRWLRSGRGCSTAWQPRPVSALPVTEVARATSPASSRSMYDPGAPPDRGLLQRASRRANHQ
jgi:hypothetical protein